MTYCCGLLQLEGMALKAPPSDPGSTRSPGRPGQGCGSLLFKLVPTVQGCLGLLLMGTRPAPTRTRQHHCEAQQGCWAPRVTSDLARVVA